MCATAPSTPSSVTEMPSTLSTMIAGDDARRLRAAARHHHLDLERVAVGGERDADADELERRRLARCERRERDRDRRRARRRRSAVMPASIFGWKLSAPITIEIGPGGRPFSSNVPSSRVTVPAFDGLRARAAAEAPRASRARTARACDPPQTRPAPPASRRRSSFTLTSFAGAVADTCAGAQPLELATRS